MLRYSRNNARTHTVPAPVGGLNDRDSLVNMNEKDAVLMVNWWPEPSRLVTRKGCIDRNTGFTSPVQTIVEYAPTDDQYKLFAVSGGELFDVTNTGEIGAPLVSGLANSQWQDTHVTTPGGNFLYLFNGVDKPLFYDGAAWVSVDDTSTPSITGVDTATLKQGTVFKGRLYMAQANSLSFWYMPPLQIGGEAKEFNLSSIFTRGGSITGVYTWTLDAGSGSDDHLVVLTSEGEVAVYSGVDPDVVGSFALIGVFYLGRPVGNRPATKFGGDLLILCEQGIYPLSLGLLGADVDRRTTRTQKIQNTITSAISSLKGQFGFEICGYPARDAIIVNVPEQRGHVQYVQNTITGAWTRFEGWNANTFKNTSFGLLFADDDSIKLAWQGESDAGKVITAEVVSAFHDYKEPVRKKLFTLIKPYFRTNGRPAVLYGMNGDYILEDIDGSMGFSEPTGMFWGSMIWGNMFWGASFRPFQNWQSIGKLYRAAAVRLKVQNNFSSVEWSATDVVYQQGGIL